MRPQWMSSSQAAAALGVKPASLYAYVSRGVIARHVAVIDGRRVSRFLREDVLALAGQRTRPRSGVLTTLIDSDVTQLDAEGALAFRGVDASVCARWGFERTAQHVLGDSTVPWPSTGECTRVGAEGVPPGGWTDTIRKVVLELADGDPVRSDMESEHCRQVAMAAVEASVRTLTSSVSGSVAQRLTNWWAGGPGVTTPCDARAAVDVALAVLVDHELTASTLAARAAAGVRADPWMVLLTGLAAMSGSAQAAASHSALDVVRAWCDGHAPEGDRVPGFGHKVYVGPDPRAELVVAAVAAFAPETVDMIEALSVHVARSFGFFPNVDVALAALILAADLPDQAGEVIFTLARIPGLMAHAMEEYPHGLRLRPRALN